MKDTKTDKNIPEEVEKIEIEKVRFNRTWAFWENYIDKERIKEYSSLMRNIFEWDNLIKFWQFWNKYPGSDAKNIFFDGNRIVYYFKDKNRINAMNVFVKGIRPEWEDQENAGGKYFQLDYKIDKEIDKFFQIVSEAWQKLILNTMGENIPCAEYINGIRFVDKTQFEKGRIIMFRFEIWINKKASDEERNKLKDYLKDEMECPSIEVKNIDVK